jgi:hypothetical protein
LNQLPRRAPKKPLSGMKAREVPVEIKPFEKCCVLTTKPWWIAAITACCGIKRLIRR